MASIILAFGILSLLPAARGEEPADQFLEALRGRGYNEMALEYLDRMQDSPLAPAEFRETLQYERGVTLVHAAREERELAAREKLLDQAQENLQQFIDQHAGHVMITSARSQLGNLLVERGRMKIEQAERDKAVADSAPMQEARQLFEKANTVFGNAIADLRTQLEQMKGILDPKTESKKIALRDRLRGEYVQAQLLAAAALEESARTVPESSPKYQELLTKAAEQYGSIYEKYRTRTAGLYARMYQGRCNQKLGKLTEALSYYGEVLDQPDVPAFREVKTKTMELAMQCWLDESQQKYVEAIARGGAWIESAGPADAQDPAWLSLRLQLARAHRQYAEKLEKTNPKDKQVRLSVNEAKQLATFVSRFSSPYQQEARQLLAELGGPDRTKLEEAPETFTEAKDAGKEALDAMQTATVILQTIPDRLKVEQDEAIKAELQTSLDEAQKTVQSAEQDALDYYRLALQLADAETPAEDVNIVRYFLSFLYFKQEAYYDAAVMGEFVARRYPGSSVARQSAEIALAAYLRLYNDSPAEQREFETRHVIQIADYVISNWPEEPQGQTALKTLIPFLVGSNELDKALTYLEKIPKDSGQRSEAELRVGRALWTDYLRQSRQLQQWEKDGAPEEVDVAARQAAAEQLKQQAEQILTRGIATASTDPVTTPTALGALYLVQVYVETGQPRKALELLEHEQLGPLSLVEQKHSATAESGFIEEAYRTALRTYISALASSDQPDQLIQKARSVMDAMKSSIGSSPEGQKQLVAIYIALARDLQEQMDNASAEARRGLSKGFETFLRQVGKGSNELNVINWVAETFYGMGESFEDPRSGPTAQSKAYFGEAATAYQKILDRAKQEEGWLDPQLKTQVELRLAMSLRNQGEFQAAVNRFESILSENNMMLNVQVEAARTYQQWAGEPGNEVLYLRAAKGGRPDKTTKRNTIWGWIRLSQITGRYHPKYRDQFHEARYNLAVCHYRYARAKPEKKSEYMKYAQKDIVTTKLLYPEMGGDEWQNRYDNLLRLIQKELGEKAVGLAAVEAKPANGG